MVGVVAVIVDPQKFLFKNFGSSLGAVLPYTAVLSRFDTRPYRRGCLQALYGTGTGLP